MFLETWGKGKSFRYEQKDRLTTKGRTFHPTFSFPLSLYIWLYIVGAEGRI
jgi:hypothetical protein